MTQWVSKAGGCLGPKVYPAVPDGDWGWVVAVAFFFVEVFTYGVIKSFGVFLQDLMSDFSESNSRVSWVISICVFVMTFTAPLSSVMSNRFGFRPVVMLGGFLISLGTITSAFTNSINEMYITIGIVSGLGYCLTFLPTVTILSQYFTSRRSLVTAVASTGESFSIFAFAPAFTALKQLIGWRLCLVVIGVLQSSIIICGALLRPIVIEPRAKEEEAAKSPSSKQLESKYALENEHTRTSISSTDSGVQSLSSSRMELAGERGGPEQKALMAEEGVEAAPRTQPQAPGAQEPAQPKLLDFSVLREASFVCYALFGLFATLGFFAPQLYVIDLSVSRGVARDRAAYMLSVMAVAEILGRLSIGFVLNRRPIRKVYILLGCVSLLCLVLVLFTAVREFWGLSVCCALYGFLLGTVASSHIPMLAEDDVVGIDRMPSAAGVYVFIQSFAGLAGPPLGGVLVDVTKNYGSAFYSCAIGMGLGAIFLGLVRPAKAWRCCATGGRQSEREREAEQPAALPADEETPEDFLEVDVAVEVSPAKRQPDEGVV
ncbi:solute carrier family 16 member 6b [Megalops cyprinoides]|uniref:solute carrier family 16 member 6b n=1 Tax=Megalops cyprinoides TaxID=118141 RepID=UPI00186484E1|nr:solute carrier family 16 member 6b [Megalops cyprinoides]